MTEEDVENDAIIPSANELETEESGGDNAADDIDSEISDEADNELDNQ